MAGTIRVGTSGWSYPRGRGSWNGIFYPAGAHSGAGRRRFDELAYYAERFDTVEVNSTFYRVPSADMVRGWVRRTPPGFEFALKLFQKFTHPGMFRAATGAEDPSVGAADVDEFRRVLEPLASAGKLGALLAQFPPSFKDTPASREHLEWLLRAFADYPVAVELRHRSWSDAAAETGALLRAHGAALVQIDEPKFRSSIRQDFQPTVPTFYYMRLHGRNAAQWWDHETADDRYNYLYSARELEPFAETALEARRRVKKLFAYMNNHFEAKAVANAVMLRYQLGIDNPGEYPPEFVERYPDTRVAVTVLPRRLPLQRDLDQEN